MAPVSVHVSADDCAALFLIRVFRLHGLPESIVSDRDPRFMAAFWRRLFELLGTRLLMATAAHPQTDIQTERVKRILDDILRSYATSFTSWSDFFPLAEFALNNAVHASKGHTPFFVNNARHPRVPALLAVGDPTAAVVSTLGAGGVADLSSVAPEARHGGAAPLRDEANATTTRSRSKANQAPANTGADLAEWASKTLIHISLTVLANFPPKQEVQHIDDAQYPHCDAAQAVARFVRDALEVAVDKKKENTDKRGRKNFSAFNVGDRVLLSTDGITDASVTNLGASLLAPRFIGPFKVMKTLGDAYTLAIPSTMRLHPTFYVADSRPTIQRKSRISSPMTQLALRPAEHRLFQTAQPLKPISSRLAVHIGAPLGCVSSTHRRFYPLKSVPSIIVRLVRLSRDDQAKRLHRRRSQQRQASMLLHRRSGAMVHRRWLTRPEKRTS